MKNAIYYLATLNPSSGGEYVIFDHVRALRQSDIRAFCLVQDGVDVAASQLSSEVPIVSLSSIDSFREDDFLVVPECLDRELYSLLSAAKCQRLIHNQNFYYSFRGFSNALDMDEYSSGYGICCSDFIRMSLYGIGSRTKWHTVRPYIPDYLSQMHKTSRKNQIAYMPRKRPMEASLIIGVFRSLYPEFRDIEWVPIDGVSRREVFNIMSESNIFASLSFMEGLGLPPLEAMACGCIPVGYLGGGGVEYATANNGFWVNDDSPFTFAKLLSEALRIDLESRHKMYSEAQRTLQNFSEEKFKRNLVSFWKMMLSEKTDRYILQR